MENKNNLKRSACTKIKLLCFSLLLINEFQTLCIVFFLSLWIKNRRSIWYSENYIAPRKIKELYGIYLTVSKNILGCNYLSEINPFQEKKKHLIYFILAAHFNQINFLAGTKCNNITILIFKSSYIFQFLVLSTCQKSHLSFKATFKCYFLQEGSSDFSSPFFDQPWPSAPFLRPLLYFASGNSFIGQFPC